MTTQTQAIGGTSGVPYRELRYITGLVEAEGSFTVSQRGDMQFVVTQGYLNMVILHYLVNTLGFGTVVKQGARTFRYVVQDKEGLRRIIEILNGQLYLKKRLEGFERFVKAYNERYGDTIEVVSKRYEVTAEDP